MPVVSLKHLLPPPPPKTSPPSTGGEHLRTPCPCCTRSSTPAVWRNVGRARRQRERDGARWEEGHRALEWRGPPEEVLSSELGQFVKINTSSSGVLQTFRGHGDLWGHTDPVAGAALGAPGNNLCSVRLVWLSRFTSMLGVPHTFGIIAVVAIEGHKGQEENKRHKCLEKRHGGFCCCAVCGCEGVMMKRRKEKKSGLFTKYYIDHQFWPEFWPDHSPNP